MERRVWSRTLSLDSQECNIKQADSVLVLFLNSLQTVNLLCTARAYSPTAATSSQSPSQDDTQIGRNSPEGVD